MADVKVNLNEHSYIIHIAEGLQRNRMIIKGKTAVNSGLVVRLFKNLTVAETMTPCKI